MPPGAVSALGSGPYGDADNLKADLEILHSGMCEILQSYTGIPLSYEKGSLPAVAWRGAMERAFKAMAAGAQREQVAEVLRRDLPAVDSNGAQRPQASRQIPFTVVTRAECSNPYFSPTLRAFERGIQIHETDVVNPTIGNYQQLDRVMIQLASSIGDLGPDTLSFVDGVLFFAGSNPVESAFLADAPGIVAVNASILDDTLALGDALLHESCHQKSYDIMATREVQLSQASCSFAVPWNAIGGARRRMNALRVLSALHVYMHLLAFLIGAAQTAHEGNIHVLERLVDYWRRARYFMRLAEAGGLDADLTRSGRGMASWLVDVYYLHARDLATLGIPLDTYWDTEAESQCLQALL